jgi:hypothetical protein
MTHRRLSCVVIPAKAGTHLSAPLLLQKWVPAFAGMTDLPRA